MSSDLMHKKVRKGTKSCTECRRRKVRCTWTSDDAQVCRRCEERGTDCIAQIYSSQPLRPRKLTSRDRIAQLEAKVASLTKVIQDFESKTGQKHVASSSTSPPITVESLEGSVDSDDESSLSDGFPGDRPRHLNTLFQNEWIDADKPQPQSQQPYRDKRSKASVQLIDTARQALQQLIPSRDDIASAAGFASQWLHQYHLLWPLASNFKSHHDILLSYDQIQCPNVDPINLAQWLLAVALTVQQSPQDRSSPMTRFKTFESTAAFSRAVAEAVEHNIFNHDCLLGTVDGLIMSMLFLRLQLTRANLHRPWLQLRRVIAISELIGLPKAARNVHYGKVKVTSKDDPNFIRSELWESICSFDRISGFMWNIPVSTKRYLSSSKAEIMTACGTVMTSTYMKRLTDLSTPIQDLDDLNTNPETEADLYAAVLKLDRELRTLASLAPRSWWEKPTGPAHSDDFVQFWHHYITLRVHLPFTLRQDPCDEYVYSRLAGMDACKSLAQRYLSLRRSTPDGFYTVYTLDLQAFIACVVLILATYTSRVMNRQDHHNNGANTGLLLQEVVKLMVEKSNDPIGPGFARRGAEAITSLMELLLEECSTPCVLRELTIKVPLLGKLHVRRVRPGSINSQRPPVNLPQDFNDMNTAMASTDIAQQPVVAPSNVAMAVPTMASNWAPDPISWSIEDSHEAFFQQEAVLPDAVDQYFNVWQQVPANKNSAWTGPNQWSGLGWVKQ